MKRFILLYTCGLSLMFHGALLTPVIPWPHFSAHPPQPSLPQKEETVVYEIRQFYAEKARSNSHLNKKVLENGMGLKKQIESYLEIHDELTYSEYIRDLIASEISVSMKKSNQQIAVRVVFVLNEEGKMVHLEIPPAFRSTSELYNQKALTAVKKASQYFPPFPPQVQKKTQCFSFVLLFPGKA